MIILKKIICLVLSLVVIITVSFPIAVYGNVKSYNSKAHLIQEGDYSYADTSVNSVSLDSNTVTEIENLIYKNLIECNNSFNIAKFEFSLEQFLVEFPIIYSNVINNHPELFYVSSNINFNYNQNTPYLVVSVFPGYTMSKEEILSAKTDFDNEITRIISKTDDTMTDLQKALTVHDYICSLAIYPTLIFNDKNECTNDKDIYHSAYGFVKDRKIVCAGYTLIYSAVMNKLNIPCRYVISDKMSHAWNAICINNKWYNVDLTWDDSTYCETDKNNMSKFAHNYFLKSQYDFETNKNHEDIIYPDGIECTDTTYDNAFWDNYISNIYSYKGDYYYLDLDAESFKINIIKRDKNGNTSIINKNIYKSMYSKYSSGISSPYAYLVKIGNVLYFTASNSTSSHLYYYDLLTNKENEFKTFSNRNMGLGEIDGTLYYALLDDKYNYNRLDKLDIFMELYNATSSVYGFSPYLDINRDGYINAKDYASIYISQKNKQFINFFY